MTAAALIGYGAAAIAAALCLYFRQKAKRSDDRLISETVKLKGEIDVYKKALDRAATRIRKLTHADYDSGLRFDETGALLRD